MLKVIKFVPKEIVHFNLKRRYSMAVATVKSSSNQKCQIKYIKQFNCEVLN